MTSKKKNETTNTEKPLLGRVSHHLKMGIVGLPNVGKSTTFNFLTKLSVPAENYPFCTIDPNKARVPIYDERFEFLCNYYKPVSRVPSYLEVVDIAGLVRGASTGAGMGNAFLSHIRAVDGIFQVVRIFEDDTVTHIEEIVDPIRDMEIISNELIAKDVEMVQNQLESLRRVARGDKTKRSECEMMEKIFDWLTKEKKEIRFGDWNDKEVELLNTLQLLTAKPVIYLLNMSEKDFLVQKNKWLGKIKQWVEARSKDPIIPYSATFELKLLNMSPEEKEKYLQQVNAKSMVNKITTTGFRTLQLINFFTVGPDEVRAWIIHKGTKAPQAAGVIHSDFEKYFICAETMSFDDFKALGSEAAVKAAGKLRTEGKTYTVQDGDIIYVKHAAGGSKKK